MSRAGARRRRLPPALAAALAAALLPALLPDAAASVPARGAGRALPQVFLLASAPDSFADLQRHAGAVGIVYPTYYDCEAPGGEPGGTAQAAIEGYALARGLRVMPRFNCQDGPSVHRILTDPRRRAATLAALVRIASMPGNRGVCLDLENDRAGDRRAMSSFVSALAARLHGRGRLLTVVAVGVTSDQPARSTGFYDYRAIGAAADRVFVLAWGAHWAGSGPGPIAPLGFVRGVARFLASLPNASRFAIGAPMYGLDWPAGGARAGAGAGAGAGAPPRPAVASQYADIVALARRVGARPRRDALSQELTFAYRAPDGSRHVVWYMDARAIDSVLRVARQAGLGVGLWRLGLEDQRVWSAGGLG